ncbi:hypothetical protein MTBUT4_310039 [Magnetospirillum sp. UT-4]|nr:hypothetical protein MTBUT4_310039 [Magnetospirillum sp. UT-4]
MAVLPVTRRAAIQNRRRRRTRPPGSGRQGSGGPGARQDLGTVASPAVAGRQPDQALGAGRPVLRVAAHIAGG